MSDGEKVDDSMEGCVVKCLEGVNISVIFVVLSINRDE